MPPKPGNKSRSSSPGWPAPGRRQSAECWDGTPELRCRGARICGAMSTVGMGISPETGNLDRCIKGMLAIPGIATMDLDAARIRTEFLREPATYGSLFGVVYRLNAERNDKPRWCDQLGFAEIYADAILASYPRAHMIHMVRDPRSMAYADRRPGTLGRMVGKWLTSMGCAERNAQLYKSRYMVVRYEDLLEDTHGTAHQSVQFHRRGSRAGHVGRRRFARTEATRSSSDKGTSRAPIARFGDRVHRATHPTPAPTTPLSDG